MWFWKGRKLGDVGGEVEGCGVKDDGFVLVFCFVWRVRVDCLIDC